MVLAFHIEICHMSPFSMSFRGLLCLTFSVRCYYAAIYGEITAFKSNVYGR